MLGEILDTYKKGNIKVNVIDSYVYPNYEIIILNCIQEQGCLHENLTALDLYSRFINKDWY